MSELQKMLSGLYYDPRDPELVDLRLNARLLTEKLNRTSWADRGERTRLLKSLFGSTGEYILVESTFNCDYGGNIHVGEGFYANSGCVILDAAEVFFGDGCVVGPQVGIYTATHPIDPEARASGLGYAKPIKIGRNCWIGGHATINPGVELGDNVVVASGSVVTNDFEDNVVVGGNPAKVLKCI